MNNITLQNGRPAEIAGRTITETNVYDLLDGLNISYIHADHPEAETMEACRAVDEALDVTMCKNLFLCNRQKTNFYLLLMPGDKPFKTKDLSAQIGSARLSFADAEAMEKYLSIKPGSVSVMGLMNDKDNDVVLLIDQDILKDEYLGCHPCVNTSSLKIKTSDILEKFLPAVKHTYKTVEL